MHDLLRFSSVSDPKTVPQCVFGMKHQRDARLLLLVFFCLLGVATSQVNPGQHTLFYPSPLWPESVGEFFSPSSIIGFRLAGWVCWGFSSRPAPVQRLCALCGPLSLVWPSLAHLGTLAFLQLSRHCTGVCVCVVSMKR